MPKPKRAFPKKLFNSQKPFPWRASIVGSTLAILGVVLLFRTFAADVNRAADLNGDGVINITDLSILLSHFDSVDPQGDINADGQVDITDLSILLTNFGKSVPPSNDPFTPGNVKALTGGNNVGLRWDSSTPPAGKTIKEYRIYRDSSLIDTVTPLPDPAPTPWPVMECFELKGNCYIDKTITKGTTYQYQVQAVTTTDEESELSAPVSVTPIDSGTPEPTITVNLNGHTELGEPINKALPTFKYLYPKIADYLSQGEYTVPTTIAINLVNADDPSTTAYTTKASEGTITINVKALTDTSTTPATVRSQSSITGTIVNAALDMALMHDHVTGELHDWSYSAVKDYLWDYLFHRGDPTTPPGTVTYTFRGSAYRSYFLDWIQKNHEPDYVHRLATLYAKKNFNASYAQFAGGKDIDQLWDEMVGMPDHTGNLTNPASGDKCLTNDGAMTQTGKLTISTCSDAAAQKITLQTDDYGDIELHMAGRCVNIVKNTDGSLGAVLQSCLTVPISLWHFNKDAGTLSKYINEATQLLCLAVQNNGTADGALVTAEPCQDGKASQVWKAPVNSPHNLEVPIRLKKDPTLCLDETAAYGEDKNQPLFIEDCNETIRQKIGMNIMSDGSFRLTAGACMQAEAGGTANGTRVISDWCADDKSFLWRYENNEFVNVKTGKCIDVGSMAVGQGTAINDCSGSDSQLFTYP